MNSPKKILNLGGDSPAYELDSSDEESLLLPAKKAQNAINFSDAETDDEAATQVFGEAATVPVKEAEDSTQVFATNHSTKKSEENDATQVFGEENTAKATANDETQVFEKAEEAATQCFGQGDATVAIADTLPTTPQNTERSAKSRKEEDEESTQGFGNGTAVTEADQTQVYPDITKDSKRSSVGPADETQLFENTQTPTLFVNKTTKTSNRTSVGPADETQLFENTQTPTLFVNKNTKTSTRPSVRPADETQLFENTETPTLFVGKNTKTLNRPSTGPADETQIFSDSTQSFSDSPVLYVNKNSSTTAKDRRSAAVDPSDATQIFGDADVTQALDDTQTPILIVSKAPQDQPRKVNRIGARKKDSYEFDPSRQNPDGSLSLEDQPTQIFEAPEDAATQVLGDSTTDSSLDQTQSFDADGFAVPAVPAVPSKPSEKAKPASLQPAVNTDELATQAYTDDSDEDSPDILAAMPAREKETSPPTKKFVTETPEKEDGHSDSESATLPVYSDDIATQAYNQETSPVLQSGTKQHGEPNTPSKSDKTSEDSEESEPNSPVFTDDLCTQAYGTEALPKRNTDDLQTQAYDEDVPKLAMELSMNASSLAAKSPSPVADKRTKPTTTVIQSSQQEEDDAPISALPDIKIQPPTPAIRPSKRKVDESGESDATTSPDNKRTKAHVETKTKTPGLKSAQRKGQGRGARGHVKFDVVEEKEVEPEKPVQGKRGRGRPKVKDNIAEISIMESNEGVVKTEPTSDDVSEPVAKKGRTGGRGRKKSAVAAVTDSKEETDGKQPTRAKRGRPKATVEPAAAKDPVECSGNEVVKRENEQENVEKTETEQPVVAKKGRKGKATIAASSSISTAKEPVSISQAESDQLKPQTKESNTGQSTKTRGRKPADKVAEAPEADDFEEVKVKKGRGRGRGKAKTDDTSDVVLSTKRANTSRNMSPASDVSDVSVSGRRTRSGRNISPASDISDISISSTRSLRSRRSISPIPATKSETKDESPAGRKGKGRGRAKKVSKQDVKPGGMIKEEQVKLEVAASDSKIKLETRRRRNTSASSDVSTASTASQGRKRGGKAAKTKEVPNISPEKPLTNEELEKPLRRSTRTPSPQSQEVASKRTTKTSVGRGKKLKDSEAAAVEKETNSNENGGKPVSKGRGSENNGEKSADESAPAEVAIHTPRGKGRGRKKTNVDKTEETKKQPGAASVAKGGKIGRKTAERNKEMADSEESSATEQTPSQRGRATKRGSHASKSSASQESDTPVQKKGKIDSVSSSPRTPNRPNPKVFGTPRGGASSDSAPGTPGTPSLRRRTLEPKPKVMFTGVVDQVGQKVIKSLGGEVVESMDECTHLVTDKVRRTVKFLCGVARGILIVEPTWLERCKQARMFIDATPFVVADKQSENNFKFSLQKSIQKAHKEGGMLSGYKIHVTKNVKPEPSMMKDIIASAEGTFLSTMPKKKTGNMVVVSCSDDIKSCTAAVNAGIPIVNSEFLLTGILRQEVDVEAYTLVDNQTAPVKNKK